MYFKAWSVNFKWHTHPLNTSFDEELVVLREKLPFYMLMKSKLGKCGIKI
jgi:hypothetical protein